MRLIFLLVTAALVASACSAGSEATSATSPAAVPAPVPSTLDDYPDLALRQFRREMREPRPIEPSAMPPRHLDTERFPDALVDRTEIVAGGPPPDGIPPLDDPVFAPIADVDDLEPQEAVLVLDRDGATRIYPVRIMIWHEIVNDVVAGEPITVTYCPLCNSAVAFGRRVDGAVLDFGTSGYLYRSALVMYDRQTESLWTHFDGRAVIGTSMGTELERYPVTTMAWSDATEEHSDALVLRGDPANPKPYGQNRYVGYDQSDRPLAGWFEAEVPEPIPLMTRVVGVRTDRGAVAIPLDAVADRQVVAADIDSRPFVVFHRPGLASSLQASTVAGGDDIGATAVFDPVVDGEPLSFQSVDDRIVDVQTSSTWNAAGRALVGPLVGTELTPLEHLDTFWFAWVSHHPETRLLTPG